MAVTNSRESVFIPSIGARARVFMREVFPGGSVGAVVFANRAPGTFTEIGSPALPMLFSRRRFCEANFFLRHERFGSASDTIPQSRGLDSDSVPSQAGDCSND